MAKSRVMMGRHGDLSANLDIATQLGLMTAAWSYLEWILGWTLIRLTGDTQQDGFKKLFRAKGTGARVNLIVEAVLMSDRVESIPDLENLLMQTKALGLIRNSLTHDVWFVETSSKEAMTFNYKEPPDSDRRRTVRIAGDIDAFRADVLELCEQFNKALGFQT